MFRLSVLNRVPSTGLTCTAEDPTYVANNLATPGRPSTPARTTALGDQRWVIPLAGSPSLGVVALVSANFASARIQGSDDGVTWTAYDQPVALTASPTGRLHHAHDIVGAFAHPYLGIYVPSQTLVSGAPYYELGGVHAGAWDSTPGVQDIGHDLQVMPAEVDQQPPSRAWRERLTVGDPYMTGAVRYRVFPNTVPGRAGLDDDLRAWHALLERARIADAILFQIEQGDPAQAWIVRRIESPKWLVELSEATTSLDFEEVVG